MSDDNKQPEPDTSDADATAAAIGERGAETQPTDAKADAPANDETPSAAPNIAAQSADDEPVGDGERVDEDTPADIPADAGSEPDEAEPAVAEPVLDPNVVAITINGRAVAARKGDSVIAAADRSDEYIPRFCYHPRMNPVGMCRQCMVEIDTGRGPMLQPACMITVAPDMAVETSTPTALRAQEGMIELLLANHPLDCPVCDKGGECPLQDQAFSHGPGESRYVEAKRNYEKPIVISDHVLLDRERCILCDRCTRFADEVAGDKLIHFIDRGNATQVNTFPDEPFASYFSGNTVQICPVGALTAKPYRFKARPWDLDQVESTCTDCSVGCRVSVHSSRDQVLRVQGVDVEAVNWGWLCDRGRFGFESVDSDQRLTQPMIRQETGHVPTSWASAMSLAADVVRTALDNGGADSIAFIGGARLTNESAFAWAQLADALGVSRRDPQLADGLPPEILSLDRATITDMASAKTVILIGPDLKEELPVLYIRLRDAIVHGSTKLIEITPRPTGLSKHAWRSVHPKPGMRGEINDLFADPDVASQIASGDVVVVAGRGNLAASESTAWASIRAVIDAVPNAKVLPAYRRGNVVGALQLGLAPKSAQVGTAANLQAAADGKIELMVLLGADPLSDFPDADLARRGIAGARRVLSLDTFMSQSSRQADIVLPAAAAHELSGTTTNVEGRVSVVEQKVTVAGTARPDWMIAAELAVALGHDLRATSVKGFTAAIAATIPAYANVSALALADSEGVLAVGGTGGEALPEPPADDPSPNSYDYRVVVSRKLYDRAVGTQMAPSLAGLTIGAGAHIHPLDLDRIGVPTGTDVQVIGARGTVVLPVVADESVPRGVLWAPFNQPAASELSADITALIDVAASVTDVRIERLP
ncbi:MAG TPA: NADH-quinone oxidoreductase subunit NuoG [Ilumatobacter sp.]|nr:NADH-quinone oxidoreductase subunit NuoG [Ilumatobacter sp.]